MYTLGASNTSHLVHDERTAVRQTDKRYSVAHLKYKALKGSAFFFEDTHAGPARLFSDSCARLSSYCSRPEVFTAWRLAGFRHSTTARSPNMYADSYK